MRHRQAGKDGEDGEDGEEAYALGQLFVFHKGGGFINFMTCPAGYRIR